MGITRVLCMILRQFMGFSLNKHIIDIWNFNTHPGGSAPWGGGGGVVPLIRAMPKFKSLFYVCAPLLLVVLVI